MLNWTDPLPFETQLAEERPRLVRLCAWLTGYPEAAEDLAQDALLAAWKSRDQLWSAEKLKPWLSGIARNICLDWSRRHYRMLAHSEVLPDDASADLSADEFADKSPLEGLCDEVNLERDLDRTELARLLDQALALLPGETAQLLVEHYLEESPHAAIAAKWSIKPGTVAVRIQRGKLTLQRILQTQLKEEALAFGLFHQETLDWEATNIWCPNCGQSRLLGQFQPNQPGGRFALRCPACDPEPEALMVALDLTKPYYAQLLSGLKAYKPAYKRIKTFVSSLYQQARITGAAACPECGKPVIVTINPEDIRPVRKHRAGEILMVCSNCSWAANSSSAGLALSLPEAEQFWRENPRIRTLPDQWVESHGVPAVVTQMESITSAATLAVISRKDTFEPLQVYTNNSAARK